MIVMLCRSWEWKRSKESGTMNGGLSITKMVVDSRRKKSHATGWTDEGVHHWNLDAVAQSYGCLAL